MNIYNLNIFFDDINKPIIKNIYDNCNNNNNIKLLITFFINYNFKFYHIINDDPIIIDKQIIYLNIIKIRNILINKIVLILLDISNTNNLFSSIKDNYNELVSNINEIDKIISLVEHDYEILNNIFISSYKNSDYIANYSN